MKDLTQNIPALMADIGARAKAAAAELAFAPADAKEAALQAAADAVWARRDDRVKVRFFAPGTAVDEDPATGSAAVAWARLMADRGEETGAVTILQGDEIGHPSTIELSWGEGRVRFGGSVVHEETRMLDA